MFFGEKPLEILTGSLLLNLIMFYRASPNHFIGSDLVCFFLLMVSLFWTNDFSFLNNYVKFCLGKIFGHLQSFPGNYGQLRAIK